MKRLLMLCTVLVPLSLLIVGCGGPDAAPSTEAEQDAQTEKMGAMMRQQAEAEGGLPEGTPDAAPKGDQK